MSASDRPGAALPAELAGLPFRQAERKLREHLRARAAAFLHLAGPEGIRAEDTFVDLGFDSLRAIDFKDELQRELGHPLRATLLFDHPTVHALTRHLLVDVLGRMPDAEDRTGRKVADSPAGPARDEAVAVIGMACRFPGNSRDPESFWDLLASGRDAITEVPRERWPIDLLHDPTGRRPGTMISREGGFLSDVDRFDADFFGISPVEARQIDPQQRLLLEIAYETFENAGRAPDALRGTRTGVFIGIKASEYFEGLGARVPWEASTYYPSGNALSTAAGRISYTFGLEGPCLAIDTACSSSLVAVHQACLSLRVGECDEALAGGVNLLLDPFSSIALSRARMLAPDGRCKTFSARADGYGRSEGCGLIMLKRLSDALRDEDPVLAIVRATGVNQDGASGGLTVPSGPSQVALLNDVLQRARVEADAISYVEAHGTGTEVGDPIEVGALDQVFGARRSRGERLIVGSLKTNIGHAETAAGIAGLIKVVLSLQNGVIPPHLHLDEPNPLIPWDTTVIRVPRRPLPWPRSDRPRLAGISSFGFSGTNCHVILEEAPPPAPVRRTPSTSSRIVVLSAPSRERLRAHAARVGERLTAADAPTLADTAFTLARGRSHLGSRLALVGRTAEDVGRRLRFFAEEGAAAAVLTGEAAQESPPVAFLFTGQGALFPGAGRDLRETFPVFREALETCKEILARRMEPDLDDLLFGEASRRLAETAWAQPVSFALAYALAELWESFGIRPDLVLGHSVGECVAATRAGVFSLEDGLHLVCERGRLMQELSPPGAMISVSCTPEEAEGLLHGRRETLSLAAVNGPRQVVLSGDPETITEVEGECAGRGLRTRRLAVNRAFHSPLMEAVLEPLGEVLKALSPARPTLPLVSCLDPEGPADQSAHASHWLRHVRAPVLFHDALRKILQGGRHLLVEIGPTPHLLGMARDFVSGDEAAFLPSLRPGRPDAEQILSSLGALHVAGAAVTWENVFPRGSGRKVRLPNMPFERRRFWLSPQDAAVLPRTGEKTSHPFLGRRLSSSLLEPGGALFRTSFALGEPAWAADHRVHGEVLLPAAAFVELALAGGRELLGSQRLALSELTIASPLLIDGDDRVAVETHLHPDGKGGFAFRIAARADGAEWRTHAQGTLRPLDAGEEESLRDLVAAAEIGEGRELDRETFYELCAIAGLDYGERFRVVRSVSELPGAARGLIEGSIEADGGGTCILSPTLLDGLLQLALTALPAEDRRRTWLPVGMDGVLALAPPVGVLRAFVRLRETSGEGRGTRVLDLVLMDGNDAPLAGVRGLRLVPAAAGSLQGPAASDDLCHHVEWVEAAPPEENPEVPAAARGFWALLGEEEGPIRELARELERRGLVCRALRPAELLGTDLLETQAAGGLPVGVIHMASLHADGVRRRDLDGEAMLERCLAEDLLGPLPAIVRRLAQVEGSLPPRLVFVTRGAWAAGLPLHPLDPAAAALQGAANTIALEHPRLAFLRLDLDPDPAPGESAALAAEILRGSGRGEDRIALRAGRRLVPRLRRGLPKTEATPARVTLRKPGVLEDLTLASIERRPPAAGEVEVGVLAAGLNFKDVLRALGLLEGEGPLTLGFECAGEILAVGEGVEHLRNGDRVVLQTPGCMATHLTLPASHVVRMPEGLSPSAAAGILTPFTTALHALEDLARVQPGETLLIHTAAGGVGQAAIQVARRLGATVFGTASEAKRDHLRRQGLVHVADSRSASFHAEIKHATRGRGVDVVLNTLSGELARLSLDLVAPGGRFIELGKRDVPDAETAASLRPDVAFHAFDLSERIAEDPDLGRSLVERVLAGFASGTFSPAPFRTFPLRETRGAFTHLAAGRNLGKVVLGMPGIPFRPEEDGSGTVLITGGLGALGIQAARALVGRGVRNLALLGRTPPAAEARSAIRCMEEAGARILVLQADVSRRHEMERALESCERSLPELQGVIHAAGVLRDATLLTLDEEMLRIVFAPKVAGAWNLHRLTAQHPLRFFVCYSSVAGILGHPGQTAYGAANAFLDALCLHRRALGLPATSIAWGPFSEAGMAARMDRVQQARRVENGLRPISPEQGAELLLRFIEEGAADPIVLSVAWERFLQRSPRGGLLSEFACARSGGAPRASATGNDALREITAAGGSERRTLLERHLRTQVAAALGFDDEESIASNRPFTELGVDSLLAVDVRNRIETSLALSLPPTLLFEHPTLDLLAAHILQRLDEKEDDPLLEHVEELSDDEVRRMIARDGEHE